MKVEDANEPGVVEPPDPPPGKHRLAGMALRNGVLIIGPTHWGCAVRDSKGRIVTATRRRTVVSDRTDDVPALRGPVRLAEMIALLPAVRKAVPEARLAFESPSMIGGTVAGSVAARALRGPLGRGGASELAGSVTALGLVLASMRGGEVARYHGAEHKVIGGYEQDIPAREAPKEHPRCGTHLAVPMLLANAAAVGGTKVLLRNNAVGRIIGLGAGLAASTELARAMQRKPDTPGARLASKVGMALQSIASTSEPTDAQLEVAQAAIDALLSVESAPQPPKGAAARSARR